MGLATSFSWSALEIRCRLGIQNHITSRRELHSISGLYTRLLLSDLIFSGYAPISYYRSFTGLQNIVCAFLHFVETHQMTLKVALSF